MDCRVKWCKDGAEVEEGERFNLKHTAGHFSLLVKCVSQEDAGRYSCEIENDFGKVMSECLVEVEEIIESPEFVSKLQAVHVAEGKLAEFVIKVKGIPSPTVEWLKDEKPLKDLPRYNISEEGDNVHKLTIENCRASDKGRIKCIARSKAGEKSCWADLLIQQKIGPPRIEVIGDLVKELDEGNSVVFEADVSGKPKARVEWTKNGKPVAWSGRKCEVKAIGDKQTLTISKPTEKDCGEYKLLATSSAGKEAVTFVLKKKGSLRFSISFLYFLRI